MNRQHPFVRLIPIANENLWRLDTHTGQRRMLVGSTYNRRIPQYSPDGRKIAFNSNRSGNIEVWTCDADGSNCLQLTSFGGPMSGTARWSPDGRWVALDSRVEGWSEIYVIAADGGTPRRVTNGTGFNNTRPSWSHDGRWLYFTSDRTGRQEIWKTPVAGGQVFQITRMGGAAALNSPEGKYIYYVDGGDHVQVTSGGGTEPVWAHNAEIFYRAGDEIRVIRTRLANGFESDQPLELFRTRIMYVDSAFACRTLDISPDGNRILAITIPEESRPRQIDLLLNWTAILSRQSRRDAARFPPLTARGKDQNWFEELKTKVPVKSGR